MLAKGNICRLKLVLNLKTKQKTHLHVEITGGSLSLQKVSEYVTMKVQILLNLKGICHALCKSISRFE